MTDALISALPLPAVLIGANERVLHANHQAEKLFGTGIVGRHYITVMRQPVLLDAVETALRLGRRTETRYLTSEARRDITWFATIAPVKEGSEIHTLVCFEDRTAMQEAGQMRRDFVANVSHELRTPLTALLGFIETLRGAAKDDPEARDRFLSIMEREASRMNRLVSDLLSLGRVEADERMQPTDTCDIAQILRRVLATLAPQAAEAEVSLTSNGADAPIPVRGDEDQIAQVFTNLIENAIKYSGRGARVEVASRVEDASTLLRGKAVTVTIADTGDGFDPIHIPRLTERFYRVDTHRSREMGGTGLGLAIVKHIVNRHRGRLRIESKPGVGSRFSVILPAI